MPEKFWRGTERLLVGGRLAEVMEWPADTTEEIVTLLGKDGHLRFQVVGLELWARIFLNGEAPAALSEKLTVLAGDTSRAPSRRPTRRRRLMSSPRTLLKSLLRRLMQFARQGRRALRRQLWRQGRLLNWFAVIRRKTLRHVTFVGITGSCGKTTTTGLVAAVLESAGRCRMQAGDNRHQALIKNVLSVDASTKFCVQEVSGSWPGRIAVHCRVLQPQVGIVTTVGSDHYKNYRSLEATARSKGQLVELLPSTGIAILNADDPHVMAMASRTSARVVTFGTCPNAELRATQISSDWPGRLTLTVHHGQDTLQIRTRLVGEHWTTSVLAAIACGLVCGVDLGECARRIENFEPAFGRHSVHVRPDGPVYIFDHKAPVWTIAVSLAFLKAARAPRTTAVFGTISDYPGSARGRYRRVARDALEVVDRVVFVGPNSGHVSRLQQHETQERLYAFETSYQASAFLAQATVPGELIYIKGSLRADHLERIMLSQLDRVVCWRERCGKGHACLDCSRYGTAEPPPPSLGSQSAGSAYPTNSRLH
jgi:UDP-N-acetylmuramoyl-tripeptide--D-alanyl-D-alanine ligase